MPKIFISYRRADSLKDAGRIYDRLVEAFGRDNVFKDVDSIPLGKDFRGILREAVARCDVQLAIIGRLWLDVKDTEGKRRLDNPDDFVRIEIESALQRDSCLVIPICVDNASMPSADNLPLVLRELAFKNAAIVRDDPDFHKDLDKIIYGLRAEYGEAKQEKNTARYYDVNEAIKRFFEAFGEKDWELARQLLAEIRASGKAPRVFKVDEHEQDVWAAIQEEERDNEYAILRLMQANPARLWSALQEFWQSYPDYDPDNLARFKPQAPKQAPVVPVSEPIKPTNPSVSAHVGTVSIPSVKTSKVLEVLPAPFNWCPIPAGKVTLTNTQYFDEIHLGKSSKTKSFEVPVFDMAKYPVTNAQFTKFIESGGYKNQAWWTEAGWAQREKDMREEPLYWQDSKWNGAEQPVVGVSWYEAIAFCLWLSETSGEKIMLPTERQWQRAAQGDDGRTYPWGKDWDASRCNNNINYKGDSKTSSVNQYEDNGNSPFDVVDMAGNVWEWCLTDYNTRSTELSGTNVRSLCGGSWLSFDSDCFRCDGRDWLSPDIRDSLRGFRIARSFE